VQGNFCKVLQINPGTALVKEDIVLERASAQAVKIQDMDGRPLLGAWVTGSTWMNFMPPTQVEKESCTVYGVDANNPRLMVFYQPNKRLFGSLVVKADQKDPVAALTPPGQLKGRLVSNSGKPLAGHIVQAYYVDRQASEIYDHAHRTKRIETDANGAFQIDELIPGLKFKLYYSRGNGPILEGASPVGEFPVLVKNFLVQPEERLDVGDLKVKPVSEED
jgi:hypothetical protein